jgi:acyl dehydratase
MPRMPINPNAVGNTTEPYERTWESKDCLLYAVGVGAGLDELQFTTENSHDITQQVLPTFAVIVGMGGGAMGAAGEIDFTRLVHGAQAIRLFKPLPTDGKIMVTDQLTSIQDKGEGKHAILETTATSVDAKSGEKLMETVTTIVLRGQGGFGGDRGEAKAKPTPPDRAPDHEVTYQTRPDQALTYRLSGDRNPLHSDPWFAQLAGFERPILHGLCTYGFTGRALLHALCGGDPAKFGAMEGRFSSPVYPGEALTTRMWVDGNQAIFQTTASPDDRVVIDDGRFEYA